MNLEFIYRKDSNITDIKTNDAEGHLLRVFLLSITDKVVLKVIRKLIRRTKGSYFLGEFLTFKVTKDRCIIIDDFELDLGVEKIEVNANEILELLGSWEDFLVKHNKLQEN